MIEFKDATIAIQWQDPDAEKPTTQTHPGRIAVDTGLGYWISANEGADDPEPTFYALTHIPSGRRIGDEPFYDENAVQGMIAEIAPLMNWRAPMEDLPNDPNYETTKQRIRTIYEKYYLQGIAACGKHARVYVGRRNR